MSMKVLKTKRRGREKMLLCVVMMKDEECVMMREMGDGTGCYPIFRILLVLQKTLIYRQEEIIMQ